MQQKFLAKQFLFVILNEYTCHNISSAHVLIPVLIMFFVCPIIWAIFFIASSHIIWLLKKYCKGQIQVLSQFHKYTHCHIQTYNSLDDKCKDQMMFCTCKSVLKVIFKQISKESDIVNKWLGCHFSVHLHMEQEI